MSQPAPLDANADGSVSAIDALVIINYLSSQAGAPGEGEMPTEMETYDSNGDGAVSVLDALQIINYLSRSTTTAAAESVETEYAMPRSDALNQTPAGSLDEDLIRMLADDQLSAKL